VRGTRLPDDVRRDLIAYVRRRRSDGVGIYHIARITGVLHESIRRWTQRDEARAGTLELVAVEVRDGRQ